MKLQFEANQKHQEEAVEALIELFSGLPKTPGAGANGGAGLLGVVANDLAMVPEVLLENLKKVQERNGIDSSDELKGLDLPVAAGDEAAAAAGDDADESLLGETHEVPNFSVEMETGTGKTYVYIRTALQLAETYGLKKFIIVVPSVAIREGTLKALDITKSHFQGLFGNLPYSYYPYDGTKLSRVRQFANSDQVELMVMTLDSFNKEANVIRQPSEKLQGDVPLDLIRDARPVLILDEPQNMESVKSRRSLGDLNPLCILRFSATLKNAYNLIYRVTPYDAYVNNLVKQIEVAGIEQDLDANRPYIELVEVVTGKGKPKAKLKVIRLDKKGNPKVSTITAGFRDDLRAKTGREDYEGYRVTNISARAGQAPSIEFGEAGVRVREGESLGGDKKPIFAAQVRQTIEAHLQRQQDFNDGCAANGLDPAQDGIKVLSLFFIDKVSNYRTDTGDDGMLVEMFDRIFRELRDATDEDGNPRYPWAVGYEPEQLRGAYFAVKKRAKDEHGDALGVAGGDVLKETQASASSKEDAEAFSLIMREKERLLSESEPVRFIFSHSALREGWDNPNVFQICTLNTTASTDRKRQELGRGLRLCVNQAGVRVKDDELNVLTVVPNENYERYVRTYQAEIEEEFGSKDAGQQPKKRRDRHTLKLRQDKLVSDEFRELWERIRVRTRYSVNIDRDHLVEAVVKGLEESNDTPEIPTLNIVVARVDVAGHDDAGAEGASEGDSGDGDKKQAPAFAVGKVTDEARSKVRPAGVAREDLPNLPALIADLLAKQNHPVRITRRTILRIVQRAPRPDVAFANPQAWAAWVAREISWQLTRQLIAKGGVTYTRRAPAEWYKQERFQDILTWKPQAHEKRELAVGGDASLYEELILDSGEELRFLTERLLKDQRVKLFVKLPNWFRVETPVGEYNPDWAIVVHTKDPAIERVYLVRETKSDEDLRASVVAFAYEKTQYARKHFAEASPEVHYEVTTAEKGMKVQEAIEAAKALKAATGATA